MPPRPAAAARSSEVHTRVAREPWRRACVSFLSSAILAVLAPRSSAAIPRDEPECKRGAATFEIAPWLALGGGVRRERDGDQRALGTVAMDVAVTVPVLRNLRVGAWAMPGTVNFTSFDLAGGARIELQTNDFIEDDSKLFRVPGRWTLLFDTGVGNRFGPRDNRGEFVGGTPGGDPRREFFLARIAVGFTAPNRLGLYRDAEDCRCGNSSDDEPLCRPRAGIVAGVRPYVAMQRAFDASRTEVTAGLEFEVYGAAWWLLGLN